MRGVESFKRLSILRGLICTKEPSRSVMSAATRCGPAGSKSVLSNMTVSTAMLKLTDDSRSSEFSEPIGMPAPWSEASCGWVSSFSLPRAVCEDGSKLCDCVASGFVLAPSVDCVCHVGGRSFGAVKDIVGVESRLILPLDFPACSLGREFCAFRSCCVPFDVPG